MFPGLVCFGEIAPTDTECKYYVNYLWRRPPSAKLHPKRGAKNKLTGDTYCLRRTSSDKLESNAIIICQHTAQNYALVLRCGDNVLWYGCCKERMVDKNPNLDNDLRTSLD